MIMKYEDEKPYHQLFDNLEDPISILEMDIIDKTEEPDEFDFRDEDLFDEDEDGDF